MKEPNLKRYGENTPLIRKMKENNILKLFTNIYELAAFFYFTVTTYIMIEEDFFDIDETSTIMFFVFAAIDLICSAVLIVSQLRKRVESAHHASAITASVWLGYCVHALLEEIEFVKDISVAYLILMVVFVVVEYIFVFIDQSKKSVVVANLRKGYLNISENNLSGISYSNIEAQGDGVYFELNYGDIKNIRRGSSADKYYNLFLDCTHGTYKLSIGGVQEACNTISYILKAMNSGKDPFVKAEQVSVNNISNQNECSGASVESPVTAESQAPVENVMPPVTYVGNLKKCPNCGSCNGMSRTECYNCGIPI